MKRNLVETLERRKDQMIGSLWANSNYDDDKGTRKNAIEEIESNFEEAVNTIYGTGNAEAEIDENNPFFAKAKSGIEKIQAPRNDEGSATVKDVVENDYSRLIDQ